MQSDAVNACKMNPRSSRTRHSAVTSRKNSIVFRKRVDIAPRAFTALQGTDTDHKAVTNRSVFEALLNASPASLMCLFRVGIPVEKLFSGSLDGGPAALHPSTLDWTFKGYTDYMEYTNLRLCKAASLVKKTSKLSETDLFQSLLQTAYTGPKVFKTHPEGLSSFTTAVGDALVEAGAIDDGHFTESWDGEVGGYRAVSAGADQFGAIRERIESIAIAGPSHDLYQFALWQDSNRRVRVRPFGVGALGVARQPYFKDGDVLLFVRVYCSRHLQYHQPSQRIR